MRVTVDINEEILRLARFKAVESKTNLAGVIEIALKKYLPAEMGVKLTGNPKDLKLEFTSGEKAACDISPNIVDGVKQVNPK